MLLKELCRIKNEKKLASIYTDLNNTSKFIVGYIVGCNNENFIISMISPEGMYDGILLKEVNSVFRISTDGEYEEKIIKLYNYHKEKQREYNFDNENLIQEVLQYAKNSNFIVSIELLNSGYDDIIGFVDLIESGSCIIKEINESGRKDGQSLIEISDITQISCDSSDESFIKILFEIAQGGTEK